MSKCSVCLCDNLEETYESRYDFSISSDNIRVNQKIVLYKCSKCGHLQKKCDKNILENLYNNYTVDALSSAEKKISGSKTRYEMLCENIANFIPKQGRILDVGAGSGSMLKGVVAVSGESELYAIDLTTKFATELSKIPRFKRLFTDIDKVDLEFDFISVVHTLEHIEDTYMFLQKLSRLLKPKGILLVQVPDIEENRFDIFVYDHISHFSRNALGILLSKFFTSLIIPEKLISKEITMLCTNNTDVDGRRLFSPMHSQGGDFNFIKLLDNTFAKLSSHTGRLAVFGTSPICTFFAMVVADRLAYFIDEDDSRQGKIHLGVPIVPIQQYDGIGVVLPFPARVADMIRKRLSNVNFIEVGSF